MHFLVRSLITPLLLMGVMFIYPSMVSPQTPLLTYRGELEFGLGYVNENSFKFGEYSGLNNLGIFPQAALNIASTLPYDVPNYTYWQLTGSDLGLDSRSLYAEYGNQGKYQLFLDYQEIPQYRFDDAKTPYLNSGTSNQTLPGNWVASTTTTGFSSLADSLTIHPVQTERERYRGGFTWQLARNWEFTGKYQHEIKEGNSTIAGVFATNGGNPRTSTLIAPVDYNTDTIDASIAYTGEKTDFTLAYNLSVFKNENPSLIWNNPFLRPPVNSWAVGTDYSTGARGQLALAPDNQAQQVTFNGGYRFGVTTRLTAHVSYGQMTQNDAYLPYTISTVLSVPAGLPRPNLDALIETLYTHFGLSTKPSRRLDIHANYTYDNQDNETPRDIYRLTLNDSTNQGDLLSANSRINTPHSFTNDRFNLEAGYRLPSSNKLTVGYEFEQRERDYSEVATTDEHSGWIKWWANPAPMLNGWVKYMHAKRTGISYVSNQPYLDGHNPVYIDTLPADSRFINDPLLRKYNIADRVRDEILTTLTFMPIDPVSFSFTGRYGHDDYNDSRLGLRERKDTSLTLDAAYSPDTTLTLYSFLTRENLRYIQQGFQRNGVALFPDIVRDPVLCATCGFWEVITDDEITTIGAGLEKATADNKFRIKLDYTYSESITDIIPDAGSGINDTALPRVTSVLNSFNLTGNYQLYENLGLRLRYTYELYDLDDFASDGVSVDTMANVMSLGTGALDYNAHLIGVSLVYKLQ